ncbi:MAG: amino acid permease [Bdellovibrionaceae bacterium]|nr:amino acid permease [Pseudobdellovibrionaceae bacterium]
MIQEEAGEHSGPTLKKSLTWFHLIMLGIGAIIGAGIFSITGTAAAYYSGPAIVYSFIIGGILCAFAGLCYAEMASMVPVAGSAYSYSYATMGELVAWIVGWDLILEYAFGAITVSAAWSGYFYSLMHKTLGIQFSDTFIRFTKGPWEQVTLLDGTPAFGFWNMPATFVAVVISMVLYKGLKESTFINNLIVVIKVAIVLLFIILGWSVVDAQNWIADSSVSGLWALVPAQADVLRADGSTILSYGWPGVLTGAGVVFFAYIGFDAVSTTAQECKNPGRDLPIGIMGSLVICTILYILMSLVITGVVPYKELGVPDPVAVGIDKIAELRAMGPSLKLALTFSVKLGALAGLTSVILVLLMGQSRVLYSMSRDGLLPWFDRVHTKHQTPSAATIIAGGFVALCAGFMPMSLVGELVSIGTLLAFVLVCIGIPILRITQPNLNRPFKTPLYWLIAPAGAISCLWVMTGLPHDTWMRLIIWLFIGFVIYFTYGKKHSRLRQ